MAHLVLYGTHDCHLCEEMAHSLMRLRDVPRFSLEFVDIADEAGLQETMGTRIPVLVGGGRELCAGRFDEQAVRAYLCSG